MGTDKLPLSVMLALGLAGCAGCNACVCLTPIPQDDEGGEELRPCLSMLPPEEPPDDDEPIVGPCLSEIDPGDGVEPEPRTGPCLAPPYEPPVEPDPVIPEAEPEVLPEDPPRPCLSVRWEPPPRPPDEVDPETLQICLSEDLDPEGAEGDGGAALQPADGSGRVAVLDRMAGVIPGDVLRRL
jgi:hypothetical protein